MILFKYAVLLLFCTGTFFCLSAQTYTPLIEDARIIKTDPALVVRSGYLVVPENRSKPNGRTIKIAFVFVRRPDQDARKNIFLTTTGGPGYSTIANIDSIGYNSGFLKYGGMIAFDQRGTSKSIPSLECFEVDNAIKRSYREHLNRDSLVLLAVKECRNKFTKSGIDLSSYNTIESAEDINDLRLALRLDSLMLFGISYSGGLMLTVARNHPEAVKLLMLNSPLPGFVHYEEGALLNINESLEQVFANCEKDSSAGLYSGLRNRFHHYFTGITGKKFSINYLEKGTADSIRIDYSKNELLDVVLGRLTGNSVKSLPAVMNDLITGLHQPYITEVINDYFAGNNNAALGMRYSVYCTEQTAYNDPLQEATQHRLLPWLSGYRFNNVNEAICTCWKVKPEPAVAKTPVSSDIPALLTTGDIDPWCSLYYNRTIQRNMPNAQILIFHNRSHGPGYSIDGVDYLQEFVKDPLKKIISKSLNLRVE